MNKAKRLKKEAREAATWRGHRLGNFTVSQAWVHGSKIVATACCKAKGCDAQVTINTNPAPNEIDIMGDAVAVTCQGA